MNARDAIFLAIERSLETPRYGTPEFDVPVAHDPMPAIPAHHACPDGTDMRALFIERVRANGGEVHEVASHDDVPVFITEYVARHQVRSVMLATDAALGGAQVRTALIEALGIGQVHCETDFGADDAEQHRACAATAVLGIGRAHAGIADAGAVVVPTGVGESRALSLLPEMHLALLDANAIDASLYECMPRIAAMFERHGSSAVTLIGGPSKTADIEKVLVTGVHGPRTFAVLLIGTHNV